MRLSRRGEVSDGGADRALIAHVEFFPRSDFKDPTIRKRKLDYERTNARIFFHHAVNGLQGGIIDKSALKTQSYRLH